MHTHLPLMVLFFITRHTGIKEEQPDDLYAHSGAGIEAGQWSQSASHLQGRGGARPIWRTSGAEQFWGPEEEQFWGPAVLPSGPHGRVSKSVSSDLSSYQFPLDEEEVPATHPPPLPMDKVPSGSALKKTSSSDIVSDGRGRYGNMCVWKHVRMETCAYGNMCVWVHVCMVTCVWEHVCMGTFTCMYACMCTCVWYTHV